MSDPISPTPWDLAAGNRWTLEQDGLIDHGNETILAKDGQIVAYVAGGMENGNGALLAAGPTLVDALLADRAVLLHVSRILDSGALLASVDEAISRNYAALKQAGALP